MEIRRVLTTEIGKLDGGSEFAASLRAMRTACRKFLERVGVDGREAALYANQHGHWASWTFYSALGEMRGTFGVHLARVATQFKLDVEDKLASILPAEDEEGSD
jgi:predicted LPLAT superfamily acyltransferase